MTGEKRIEELVKKGWKIVKDETTWCRYIEFESLVECTDRDSFGNATGEHHERLLHKQITIYNDGDWEETRG